VTRRCPNGHDSAALDFCDQCGTPLEPQDEATDATTVTKLERCPQCQTVRQPGDRFCEQCRYDFTADPPAPTPSTPDGWVAVVAVDRAFYDFLAPEDLAFPDDPAPPHTITLDTPELRIGRHTLAMDPPDPAISQQHARLERQGDGSYAVVDAGSRNGTWLNDDATPITVGVIVHLADGDRVHVGAWTTITVARAPLPVR
jgi:hypothetical protein